jgi:hypothetical protein
MNPNDVARYILAAIVVIGFCVIGVVWMLVPEHAANKDVLMLIVGSFCTGYGTVIGYFFSRREA